MSDRLDAALGTLVAVGGAEDRTSDLRVLSRLIALAPTLAPEVAVIATASSIPHEVLPAYRSAFSRLGAAQVHLLDGRTRAQAQAPDAVAAVGRSGVIFFTGGDQMRLTHVLGGSPLLRAIRRRYLEGAVVAGTSAGAAALPATMIAEGDAADALRKNGVKMASGLGFVDGLIVDTHFMQRGRFARLMAAGAANPEQLGVGLGEDAGVIIHDRRTLEAIGPGHTVLVDSRGVASSTIAEAEH
jgi:cyanophycinase